MNVDWELVQDVVAAVLLLGGSILTLAAGVGLVRFPDLLSRTHTAAKPQVLGLILVLLGLGFRLRNLEVLWVLVLVVLFQMLTSPVAAHMVSRAGWRTGRVSTADLVVDELSADLADLEARRADPPPGRDGTRSGDELGGAALGEDP